MQVGAVSEEMERQAKISEELERQRLAEVAQAEEKQRVQQAAEAEALARYTAGLAKIRAKEEAERIRWKMRAMQHFLFLRCSHRSQQGVKHLRATKRLTGRLLNHLSYGNETGR